MRNTKLNFRCEGAEGPTAEKFFGSSENVIVDMADCSQSFENPSVQHDTVDQKQPSSSSPGGCTSTSTLNTTKTQPNSVLNLGSSVVRREHILFRGCGASNGVWQPTLLDWAIERLCSQLLL